MTERKLNPFNELIQICPYCRKVDVYKDDGHDCQISQQQILDEIQ